MGFSASMLGVPPLRGVLLSFASPKESKQRKGDPGSAPLRGSFRYSESRAAAELGLRPQTVLADCPRPSCVAQRLSRGPKASWLNQRAEKSDSYGQPEKTAKNEICYLVAPTPSTSLPRKRESIPLLDSRLRGNDGATAQARDGLPGPLEGAEQRRGWRIKGEDCLRAKPEFRSPRQPRVAQGTGAAGTDQGRLFFAYFLLAKQKKVRRPSRA